MARKPLDPTLIEQIRELLLNGNTNLEVSKALNISAPTVAKYRATFKQSGIVFPGKRGRKKKVQTKAGLKTKAIKLAPSNDVLDAIKNSDFTYIIDGTKVSFNSRPKSLLISKKRMLVEF
jgi:hypothetical protein